MLIVTEFGQSFELSAVAYQALREARRADEAEDAFNDFAPHIPRAKRAAVWQAVPGESNEEIARRLTVTKPRARYTIPADGGPIRKDS